MANFVNVLLNIITSGRRINVKRMKYRKHLHPFSGCFEQPVSFQEVKRLVRNCNILPGVILPTLTLDLSHLLCSQCLKGRVPSTDHGNKRLYPESILFSSNTSFRMEHISTGGAHLLTGWRLRLSKPRCAIFRHLIFT